MVHIYYYVSGHGFGHSTRVAQIVTALLESPDTRITIITMAPTFLFPVSPRVSFRKEEIDSVIVQPLPYDIEVQASFTDLERFASPKAVQAWLLREANLITEAHVECVLADSPWIVGLLKSQLKQTIEIPFAIISNFSFDIIYHDLLKYLPDSCPNAAKETYIGLVSMITTAYTSFDYLLKLPGCIEYPFMADPSCLAKVIQSPLIYRPALATKEQTLERLQIPKEYRDHKILLMQFGGHAFSGSTHPPSLPKGWICLSALQQPDPHFFTFKSDFYLPDLINASSAVLGKIGYGTISECIGIGKPLIYVRRVMFAEEPYLLEYMQREGVCVELGREDFEFGNWQESIELVDRKYVAARESGIEMAKPDGSRELAEQVYTLIKESGRPGLGE